MPQPLETTTPCENKIYRSDQGVSERTGTNGNTQAAEWPVSRPIGYLFVAYIIACFQFQANPVDQQSSAVEHMIDVGILPLYWTKMTTQKSSQ